MKDEPVNRKTMANRAVWLWSLILSASQEKMPIPCIGIREDDQIFYYWNTERYHLKLEINPDMSAEFFFRDRETAEFWGVDCEDDKVFPPRIIDTFHLFTKDQP